MSGSSVSLLLIVLVAQGFVVIDSIRLCCVRIVIIVVMNNFTFQSDCVGVCVWRFLVVVIVCSYVPCAFNVALEVFTFRVLCLFACLCACSFVRAFACQVASMYASWFVRCLFLNIGFRFVFDLCCRVRLFFVFVVALFG